MQEPWGVALQCGPLAELARHCFSTRELALDGGGGADPQGWHMLARSLGVELHSLARMRQVHCADVFVAERGDDTQAAWSSAWPEADIAVSDSPVIAVSVRTADCVPVLMADRRSGAVAAVHAGWRGTAAGAAMVAVHTLVAKYGARPNDVIAAVGPSIGPCHYEVGPELADHFSAHAEAHAWFTRGAQSRLDLWRATRDQLARAGVPPQHIHVCALCTFDHPALFHSYRRDGKAAGRLVAAIRTARGRTP